MRKQLTVAVAFAIIGCAAVLGMVLAQGGPPEHPHLLVIGVEFDGDGNPTSYRRCVELAAGQALPLNAHHEHVHVGTAGEKLGENAGNFVVPAAPLTPWSNCEELVAIFFP